MNFKEAVKDVKFILVLGCIISFISVVYYISTTTEYFNFFDVSSWFFIIWMLSVIVIHSITNPDKAVEYWNAK